MEFKDMKCPLCNGSGTIKRKKGSPYSYTYKEIEQARRLHRKGLNLRQIAKEMGINHPQTINNLIRRKII